MKPTILLVDDEPMMQLLLKQLFKAEFDVHVFNNGKEALNWMYSGSIPDLAIFDLQMPEMDGLEATRLIRLSKPYLPIIAQTAFAMENDKDACMAAGCNAYIEKPIQAQKFLSMAAVYLSK